MALDKYRSSHETSLAKLIKEFGEDKRQEINRLYSDQRTLLERDAKIKEFLPIFTYKIVRQVLLAQYKPGYLEKKVEKIKDRIPK